MKNVDYTGKQNPQLAIFDSHEKEELFDQVLMFFAHQFLRNTANPSQIQLKFFLIQCFVTF